jgi:hypothetical protein
MSRGYFTVVGEEVDSFSRKTDDAAVHRVPYMEIESWRAWQCGCCCESTVGWYSECLPTLENTYKGFTFFTRDCERSCEESNFLAFCDAERKWFWFFLFKLLHGCCGRFREEEITGK